MTSTTFETSTPIRTVHDQMAGHGLVRPADDRVLAGVCAGLGKRVGLDPWPTRALLALGLLAVPGSQIVLYPVLRALMPSEQPRTVAAGPGDAVAPAAPAQGA